MRQTLEDDNEDKSPEGTGAPPHLPNNDILPGEGLVEGQFRRVMKGTFTPQQQPTPCRLLYS
ncbi:hypothetical protein E2C01_043841 [Portunus trituberculatus]|uniref:Uncharacterized protein n=1 Tax=Portunus trituberculatus TaxID=210409 RepID=A0A5B7FTZ2_PORTR|nr:hypothetical protein [Portunus trituberculatus]